MPAIITHDFFGRDVYDALFQTIGGSRDEADAFLLGNQGPDRCSTRWPTSAPRRTHKLGNTMHSRKPRELLAAAKDSLGVLDPEEKPLGRAYALGFLCHYALDSTVHPLVYCHEHALCDAGEPGLTRDDGSEVHGVIESRARRDGAVRQARRHRGRVQPLARDPARKRSGARRRVEDVRLPGPERVRRSDPAQPVPPVGARVPPGAAPGSGRPPASNATLSAASSAWRARIRSTSP